MVVQLILQDVGLDPAASLGTLLFCALLSITVGIGSVAFSTWNNIIRLGRRGASIGKSACGILVLSLDDARPIGVGGAFARHIAHLLDVVTLGIGYLWPLWDKRKQTFADKICHTGVLRLPGVNF